MRQVLTVADVAKIRQTGRFAALRWLRRNADAYLQRRGRLVVISKEDYEKVAGHSSAFRLGRFDDRLMNVEERLAEVERRTDVHANGLRKLHVI